MTSWADTLRAGKPHQVKPVHQIKPVPPAASFMRQQRQHEASQ
jgi:hypothetical protein